MPSWLRRLIARFERRWIRDDDERDRHAERVRDRLAGQQREPSDPPIRKSERPEDSPG